MSRPPLDPTAPASRVPGRPRDDPFHGTQVISIEGYLLREGDLGVICLLMAAGEGGSAPAFTL